MCAEMEIKMEIQLWKEILEPYGQAVDELVVKFNHIKREYQNGRMYSPIESVSGRVKSISSIMEKAQRKNVKIEEIEEKIEDIAGIRIICQFVEDINTVVKIIKKRGDLEVKQEKDYITNSKPSGYRSYHVIAYYTVQTIYGPKKLEVEIQIRTLAMNFWSTIEHSLQYKYKEHMPQELRKRLLSAANAVEVLDNEDIVLNFKVKKDGTIDFPKKVSLKYADLNITNMTVGSEKWDESIGIEFTATDKQDNIHLSEIGFRIINGKNIGGTASWTENENGQWKAAFGNDRINLNDYRSVTLSSPHYILSDEYVFTLD